MVSSPRLGREPGLDGLRGLAVLEVVVHHGVAYFAPTLLPSLSPGGFLGVDLFFVLSGFLITALLLQEADETGTVALRSFWSRRAARLLPALLPVLVAWTAFRGVRGIQPWPALLKVDALVLSAYSNWAVVRGRDAGAGLAHLWSLAVETQFYLLWPLLVVLVLRRRIPPAGQLALLATGIALSAGERALLWEASGEWVHVYSRTDARADALLFGAVAAVLWRNRLVRPAQVARLLPWALAAFLLVAQSVHVEQAFLYLGGFTLVAAACAVLVLGVVGATGPVRALVTARPLVYLGSISYALYLWHDPLDTAVVFDLHVQGWAGLLLATSLALVLAVLSTHLLERPVLRAAARARERRAAPVS